MDKRRLSTADLLYMDILSVTPPQTDIPSDREVVGGYGDDVTDIDSVVKALESGKLVQALNYYGIPHVWKQGDGVYRAILMQYRAVTEDHTFTTASAAAAWFARRYAATDG